VPFYSDSPDYALLPHSAHGVISEHVNQDEEVYARKVTNVISDQHGMCCTSSGHRCGKKLQVLLPTSLQLLKYLTRYYLMQ